MSSGPTELSDEEVPAWIERLGIPGLYDVHVHFMPEPVMTKVWQYFDRAGPSVGREWPITYRDTDAARVETLRRIGVRRFTALPYAHKPGIAPYLNEWAAGFAEEVPEALRCATFYPEPDAADYVAKGIADGVQVFKTHVRVGEFDPRDPLLDDVWGVLAESGTPVVVHAGSGPVAGETTGPGPMAAVLAAHPRLTAVIAHMGATEYAEFLALAERHERVYLDTTMVFTDFFEADAPYPTELLPRLVELGDKVLLGSDFPNIPYAYAHQLESLERLGLGEEWLRRVCSHNAAALLGE